MNTDRLRYDLVQNFEIKAALVAAGIVYGSGMSLFQWMEDPANSTILQGTPYEGWTHDDTTRYMIEHQQTLGYETRMDEEGNFYLVDTSGHVMNINGSEVADDVVLNNLVSREGGDDTITGSKANDVIYGQEGEDSIFGGAGDDSIYGGTGNDLLVGDELPDGVENITFEQLRDMNEDELNTFTDNVEGMEADGDEQLYGGTGDDLLLGMGGDDYLDGGEGSDAVFGGAGNDIIVYDQNDYMVSGGSGINFMVTNKESVDLKYLLTQSGRVEGSGGPIVDGIDVLIKGDDALSLTNMDQLANEYGISINQDGNLELDASKWTESNGTFVHNEANLTLETTLTQQTSTQNETLDQQVIILQHSNG